MHKSVLLKQSILFLVIIVFLLQPVTIDSFFKQTDNEILQAYTVKDLPVVNFIAVFNDNNFTDYGFPGLGTKEDPYRIENYTLTKVEYANGIVIVNTTKHFIIRNCYLMAYWSAIILENVASGTAIIKNNTCLKSDVGIGLIRSNNVSIINNTCGNYNHFGIFLYYSNSSLIVNNTCSFNDMSGIRAEWSSSNRFVYNNCSNNYNTGLSIKDSTNATIAFNTCNFNLRGGFLRTSNSIIKNNSFRNCLEYGLWLDDMSNSTISKNLIGFNAKEGCRADSVNWCNFTYNQFVNNSRYGLLLDSYSSHNLIHHNLFIGNNLTGTSQAFDSGNNNIWFDQETKEGNYWSNWSGKGSYDVDGSAGSKDKYPLNENLERTPFPFVSIIIIFVFSAVFVFQRKKRDKKT